MSDYSRKMENVQKFRAAGDYINQGMYCPYFVFCIRPNYQTAHLMLQMANSFIGHMSHLWYEVMWRHVICCLTGPKIDQPSRFHAGGHLPSWIPGWRQEKFISFKSGVQFPCQSYKVLLVQFLQIINIFISSYDTHHFLFVFFFSSLIAKYLFLPNSPSLWNLAALPPVEQHQRPYDMQASSRGGAIPSLAHTNSSDTTLTLDVQQNVFITNNKMYASYTRAKNNWVETMCLDFRCILKNKSYCLIWEQVH